MKKIGLVGGLGPESTSDYYKGIIAAFAGQDGYDYPEVFIHSLNLGPVLKMFAVQAWEDLADLLVASVEALARAGADFAAIASNTPHLVFDQVQARSPLPLVSIAQATARRAAQLSLARPGLLATLTTMGSDLYQRILEPLGMEVKVPSAAEQALIQMKLDDEIERGVFREDTRRALLGIVARLKQEQGIDGVILGCTELPLLLTRDELGLPFLNTAAIHVEAIVDYCRG
ncbi:MAG: amino acid racemase [Desulfarculaceae bacterium]|nr:amino acid racemase [Desulfarculaceae bacterium]MCF8074409.1 amino acid racemase [Desulfarculaceae bacterium]MCF8103615.1 amino acid racemase [Desulfarculaceae bacterium]MCF8116028.1 amino acid racemase [Desulfarculaceae bacterium]